MQVRCGLEVLAVRLAAERRGGEYADALVEVVERGKSAGRELRLDELPSLVMEFHEIVAKASGNRQLEMMLERVLQRISWGFELELQARIDSAWFDHSLIAMAICAGSSVQAAFLMEEHIKKDEILYTQRYGPSESEGGGDQSSDGA
jgi:DNA-binding FadR family transcriptional regulator